jgi:hypothetical protein
VAKIAFWRTVADSYRHAFDVRRLLRIAGPWIVAYLALLLVGLPVAALVPTAATDLALSVTSLLLMIAAQNAFAVAWQRSLLLRERLAFGDSFRFGRREWRFFFCYVATVLAALVPFAVASMVLKLVTGVIAQLTGIEAIGVVGAVASLVAGVVICGWASRFGLALPAAALDDAPPYLTRAWQLARGNTVRLLLGTILCVVPTAAVMTGLAYAARTFFPGEAVVEVVLETVFFIGNFVGLAAYLGFLSFAFRQLHGADRQGVRSRGEPYRPQA